jgi:hypothetical protein
MSIDLCGGHIRPHSFRYLRKDESQIDKSGYRQYDVFYCVHCLSYRRVAISETELRDDGRGVIKKALI